MDLMSENVDAGQQAAQATKELKILYDDYYKYLVNFLKEKNAFHRNISFPLLIKPFPEYFKATTKIMLFGKETFSWPFSTNLPCLKDNIANQTIVETLMMQYKNFNLGANQNSPFWHFCRQFNHKFNSSDQAFIWNNISKVDENKTTPKWDILKGCSATNNHPIINMEVELLKPDIVVLLTGSIPDTHLKNVFKGMELSRLNDVVFRIKHPLLPYHSYKTQHPKSLRMRGNFNRVIESIYDDVTKANFQS